MAEKKHVIEYTDIIKAFETVKEKLKNKSNKGHQHGNADITDIDASKIKSGTIDIDRLPKGAIERMVYVKDDAARFALTTNTAQNGDTVKVTGTKKMFYVIDDTKLSSEAGYEPYTAESASAVPWSGVTGKPTTFTPEAHTHAISEVADLQETLTGLRQDVNAKPSKDTNTTYSLIQDSTDGHKLTFKGSDGSTKTVTIPDNDHNDNTTYSLKKTGSKIQLVGSDGSTTEVTDDNTTYDLDAMINALPAGTDDPVDNDYYVSQNVDGGTSNTGYFRRPVSKLWNYIKTKLATVATSGSYTDLSNKPTIGNGKVTVNQNGTTKGTFTMNQTGDTVINLTDSDTNTNTWRDVVDSLDSTRTDASLSANQGRVLNNKIDDIQIGGRNLIKNSGVSFTVDKNSTGFMRNITLVDGIDYNEILLNKTATFSFFLRSKGKRKNITSDQNMVDRFGAHGSITWKNSITGATTSTYPFIILQQVAENQIVSCTETITPPSSGFDSIDSIIFHIQCTCVPADDNVVWKIGNFKFELGNKATDWTPAPEDLVNEVSSNYLPLHGTADIATSVTDYGDTAKHIQIGFSGAGITGDDIKYIAGYTSGDGGNLSAKIKDISKDALKSWLGLGSRAYDSTNYLPSNGGNLNGTLHVKPTTGSYTEGMRVYPYDGWSTVMLNGTDNTGTSGTSPKSWGLFNNDGKFYITKNGADSSPTAIFSNTDGTWRANGHELITAGNIGSQNVNYANSSGSANSVAWTNVSGRPSSLPANGGTSDYSNKVYATSHPGTWYLDTSWDGTYFQSCFKNGNNTLPMRVANANYADSAGSAGSVSWGNVSGRPTALSSFTNDKGYITGITKAMVTGALGYTPPTTDTNTTYSASTGLNLSGTTFSVKYGSAAGTACQGNDSRLSNARPASDVYSWAKASSKPSYTWTEISNKPDIPSISHDTPTRTNWTIDSKYNCIVYRIGDFCLAVVAVTGTIYPRQWLPAAQLSKDVTPKTQSSIIISSVSGSDHMECMVTTDGYIKMWWSGSSPATSANICIPYYIK